MKFIIRTTWNPQNAKPSFLGFSEKRLRVKVYITSGWFSSSLFKAFECLVGVLRKIEVHSFSLGEPKPSDIGQKKPLLIKRPTVSIFSNRMFRGHVADSPGGLSGLNKCRVVLQCSPDSRNYMLLFHVSLPHICTVTDDFLYITYFIKKSCRILV